MDIDLAHAGGTPRDHGDTFESRLRPLLLPGYRLAYAMLHDHGAAEDALQEAALRAWRRQGNIRPGAEMQPWFLGIVANRCREMQRSRWWSVLRVGHLRAGAAAQHAPRDGDVDADADVVRRALDDLPADQRVVVLLHYFLDMAVEDVAIAVGAPVGTVKSRLHRARANLRPLLLDLEDGG